MSYILRVKERLWINLATATHFEFACDVETKDEFYTIYQGEKKTIVFGSELINKVQKYLSDNQI